MYMKVFCLLITVQEMVDENVIAIFASEQGKKKAM